MSKRLTTEEFIVKAISIHGHKYDYSNTIYIDSKTKVKIKCKKHGIFEQIPYEHLKGSGCKHCYHERKSDTLATFINKAISTHGYKYDYSSSNYINSKTPIDIICPIHGKFHQKPSSHIQGKGCRECGNDTISQKNTLSNEEFVTKANSIHNYKYTYHNTMYTHNKSKVIITCNIHGDFKQKAGSHLEGHGCPKCKMSKGERAICTTLSNHNICYSYQHSFDGCTHKQVLPFDFYIESINTCIEYDGEQHYHPLPYFGGTERFKTQQTYDRIKDEYCKTNNIRLLRIPYTEIDNIESILEDEVISKIHLHQ